MKKRNKFFSLLLSLALGVLAALPLLFSKLSLLSFLVYIPFFIRLFRLTDVKIKTYYLHGLFFFQGYLMAAFSFFIAMYPLEFAGLGIPAAVSVILAATVLLPLFQGCFLALSCLIFGLFKKWGLTSAPITSSLTAAALISLSFFFQNFTWAGVPWASPAVSLAYSPVLIGSASLLGSGFLTFLLLFVNALLAEGFIAFRACKDKAALLSLALALGLFCTNLFYGLIAVGQMPKEEGETITVALIQSYAPVKDGVSIADELETGEALAAQAADMADVDVMIWPESIIPHALERDKSNQTFFSLVARETGAIQLIGSFSEQVDEGNIVHFYNSIFAFYPDGSMSEEKYNKRRPVPFGEYLPMAKLFGTVIPALTEINMLSRDTQAGEGANLFHLPFGNVGGLLCFDSIYPALSRESVLEGAALLVLPTNDSWFDGSAAKDIHFAHAVLRAVENRRTVVRVGDTGLSGVILPNGEVKDVLPRDEAAVAISTVTLYEDISVYTRIGDAAEAVLLAYLILYPTIALCIKHKKKGDHKNHDRI